MHPSLFIAKSVHAKGAYTKKAKSAYTTNTYASNTYANGTYTGHAYSTIGAYIKYAFLRDIYIKNIYVENISAVKNLKIYSQFFQILELKLFSISNCYFNFVHFQMYIEVCMEVDIVDFIRFVIQIVVFQKMISLDIEVKVFVVKTMADLVFEIDGNSKNTDIDLMEFLLQLSMVRF